jgi:hypothetical protein
MTSNQVRRESGGDRFIRANARKANSMARDIDYAAIAVKASIVDKYGRKAELQNLDVTADERVIVLRDGERMAAGTRDDLLAAIRAAESYDQLWENASIRNNPNRPK